MPTPIPITIVDARLETREVPSRAAKIIRMAALPGFAVLTTGRSIFILQAGKDNLEPAANLLRIPEGIDYFGQIREAGGSIFIGACAYNEEQRHKEAETPRGGFVSGPESKGLLVITDSPPAVRWIQSCRVTHWPKATTARKETAPKSILPELQDARMIGGKVHLATGSQIGILDPVMETWQGSDNNICMDMGSIVLGPVPGPKRTLFVGMDEGGLSGGWLSWARGAKSGDVRVNPGKVPSDLLAMGDRLFVATDHGVAEIIDPAGKPVVRHFADRADGKPLGPTYALLAHGKTLLAVAGDRILQLDPESHTATLHHLTAKKPIMSICRFNGHYYGIGSGPLVRFDLP